METFEITHFTRRADEAMNLDIHVRWKRREWGGWTLVHAETGRVLGWVVRDTDRPRQWAVRICSDAFRGTGADTGHVLDRVPHRLYNGDPHNTLMSHVLCESRDRWSAAYTILCHLVRHRAPAVGFDRHPEVTAWQHAGQLVTA